MLLGFCGLFWIVSPLEFIQTRSSTLKLTNTPHTSTYLSSVLIVFSIFLITIKCTPHTCPHKSSLQNIFIIHAENCLIICHHHITLQTLVILKIYKCL